MSLFDILILLVFVVVAIQFWRVRDITEYTTGYLRRYCEQQHLQFISVARIKTRIAMHRGKPDWHTHFAFEFSGNGEDAYQGTIELKGKHVVSTHMPAYKIN